MGFWGICSAEQLRGKTMFLRLLLLLLLLPPFRGVRALNSDGNSLLSFKHAILSDPEQSMVDWEEDDATPCRWSGVVCDTIRGEAEPRVVGLALAKKRLIGSLAPELGALAYLSRLNLRDNELIGSLPPALFNASRLEVILLSGNDLSGAIPGSVARLATSLQVLDLSGNGLTGSLPGQALASCKILRSLLLAANRLSGGIPRDPLPSSLVSLDLSSNQLTGSIPEELGELVSLRGTLNLSHNNLSGPIPYELGRLATSLSIDLSYNNLSGPIPLNGTLANQGPTAFLANPGLCGLPLKSKCSSPDSAPPRTGPLGTVSAPLTPKPSSSSSSSSSSSGSSSSSSRHWVLSKLGIAAICLALVLVVLLVLLLAYVYCCRSGNAGEDLSSSNDEGNGELFYLDHEAAKLFDLDSLLRARADVLGKGSSGIVYKAVLNCGGCVVVRRLGEGGGGGRRIKEFEAEVKAIGAIRHQNLAALRAYYWGTNDKLLVYDFMPNGSLARALQQHQLFVQGVAVEDSEAPPACLTWSQRLIIAKGVASGLAHIHECRNVHGNIKPSNVLLDSNLRPCISDLGISRLTHILGSSSLSTAATDGGDEHLGSSSSSNSAASSLYRPPEAAASGSSRATQKWDVYSCGVVLLELLTGSATSGLETLGSCVSRMLAEVGAADSRSQEQATVVREVAMRCLSPVAEQRPRMKQVVGALSRL